MFQHQKSQKSAFSPVLKHTLQSNHMVFSSPLKGMAICNSLYKFSARFTFLLLDQKIFFSKNFSLNLSLYRPPVRILKLQYASKVRPRSTHTAHLVLSPFSVPPRRICHQKTEYFAKLSSSTTFKHTA